jgi:hypothetical protein
MARASSLWDDRSVADAHPEGASRGESTDVVTRLARLFGLAAGVIALVYAAGGGVLALRLYLAHLPSRTIAGQLPRDLLISIGLAQIVLPVLGVAGLYAVFRVLAAPSAPPTWLVDTWAQRKQRNEGRAAFVAAVVVPALIVAGVTATGASNLRGGWEVLTWLVPVAFVVTLLDVLLGLKGRARLIATCRSRTEGSVAAWSARGSIGLMTLLVGLAALPITVIVAGTRFPLLEAKVCSIRGSEQVGVLIGETSDRTYLGEEHKPSGPLVVYSIPQSEIRETIIGGHAEGRDCPPPAAT